jgi:hypothetical protein
MTHGTEENSRFQWQVYYRQRIPIPASHKMGLGGTHLETSSHLLPTESGMVLTTPSHKDVPKWCQLGSSPEPVGSRILSGTQAHTTHMADPQCLPPRRVQLTPTFSSRSEFSAGVACLQVLITGHTVGCPGPLESKDMLWIDMPTT